MSFTMEMLPDKPILFQTWFEDFTFKDELVAATEQVNEILDAQPEPTFFITDIREVKFGMDDMIAAANVAGRGSYAPFHHQNIREVIFITTSNLVKMGAKGMNSQVFGNIEIQIFETPEDALDYCQSQISDSA